MQVVAPLPGPRRPIRTGLPDDARLAELAAASGSAPEWTPERLRWRLASPGARYAVHDGGDWLAVTTADQEHGANVAVILAVIAPAPLGAAESAALVRRACRAHRAPVALHAGLQRPPGVARVTAARPAAPVAAQSHLPLAGPRGSGAVVRALRVPRLRRVLSASMFAIACTALVVVASALLGGQTLCALCGFRAWTPAGARGGARCDARRRRSRAAPSRPAAAPRAAHRRGCAGRGDPVVAAPRTSPAARGLTRRACGRRGRRRCPFLANGRGGILGVSLNNDMAGAPAARRVVPRSGRAGGQRAARLLPDRPARPDRHAGCRPRRRARSARSRAHRRPADPHGHRRLRLARRVAARRPHPGVGARREWPISVRHISGKAPSRNSALATLLLGSLAALEAERNRRAQSVWRLVPLAIVGAGILSLYSFPGWPGRCSAAVLVILALVVQAWRAHGMRAVLIATWDLVGPLVVAAGVAHDRAGSAGRSESPTSMSGPSTSGIRTDDLGNLAGPLSAFQADGHVAQRRLPVRARRPDPFQARRPAAAGGGRVGSVACACAPGRTSFPPRRSPVGRSTGTPSAPSRRIRRPRHS